MSDRPKTQTEPVRLAVAGKVDLGDDLGMAVVIAEYELPVVECSTMAKMPKGKYLQCARELNHSELRRMALYLADTYPSIFLTILTTQLRH